MSTGESPKSFTEIPDAACPHNRTHDGQPGRPSEQKAESEQELDAGEESIQKHRMAGDQPGVPLDGPCNEERLTACRRGNDSVGETLGEHEGLELECTVKEPDASEHHTKGLPRQSDLHCG